MKCEICHKADAKMAVTRQIDGRERELYVCRECAGKNEAADDFLGGKLSVTEMKFKDGKLISKGNLPVEALEEFMKKIIGPALAIEEKAMMSRVSEPEDHGHPCPLCGMLLDEFVRSGRLGCPECYVAFSDYLSSIISDCQPGVSHVGKRFVRK